MPRETGRTYRPRGSQMMHVAEVRSAPRKSRRTRRARPRRRKPRRVARRPWARACTLPQGTAPHTVDCSASEWPSLMRMRGLEPPQSYLHTDLNRARLPIPPHPRAARRRYRTTVRRRPTRALLASGAGRTPLSSRGLGRRPLTAETRVRIPVAVLDWPREVGPIVFRSRGRHRSRKSARCARVLNWTALTNGS